MNRRTLVRAIAVSGAGLLAGCTEGGTISTPPRSDTPTASPTAAPTGTPSDTPTDAPADTDTPVDDPSTGTPADTGTPESTDTPTDADAPTERATPTRTPGSGGVTGHSFEVLDRSCGEGANRASVDRSSDRVVVEGTIDGRNGCYTAELARADYDESADELTVDVRSYESDEGGACMQCIVDVDYRATVEFDRGTPDEVHVRHDGDPVTSA